MKFPRPILAAAIASALAAPALAQTPVSGTVTGEMRLGDVTIPLTHVYVMEPFALPDAPPDPEVARRLIVILSDRPYPGDLPPMSIDLSDQRLHDPFNGVHMEVDRDTGEVLYASPTFADNALMAGITYHPNASLQTKHYQVSLDNGHVSADIAYVHVAFVQAPEFSANIAVLRGTRNKRLEALPIQVPGYAERAFGFNANFDATIHSTPRFLKTLIGHNARRSEIAIAYESHLLKEREARVAELDQSLLNSGFGEVAIAAERRRIINRLPDAADIARSMTRLQKIDLYEDRAILHFASDSFRQTMYSVTDRARKMRPVKLIRSGDSTFQQTIFGVRGSNRPITRITITRTQAQNVRHKPWSLQGESILPLAGLEPAIEIHMILDDGQWRLARN